MRPLFTKAACALGLVLALSTTAHANDHVKPGSIDVGMHFGGYFFLEAEEATDFNHTFSYGAAATFNFTSQFGAQLDVEFAPNEVNHRALYQVNLDLIYRPYTLDWFVPFFGVGPTFALNVPDGADTDVDPGVNAVIGADLLAFEHVGFRIQTRYIARFGTAEGEAMAHDLLALAGMVVRFGGEGEEEVLLLDTDGDGILDRDDVCVKVPGQASAKGCPDADGDTLADATDRCPKVAGPVALKGCPDVDGDTIVDIDDRCPKKAGAVAHKGCPDVDADSIADIDDRCPKIPGEPAYQGCPPPPPIDIVEKFSGRIDGIQFEYNKAVITAASFATLDAAAKLLGQYTQIRVLIEGHTSAEGSADVNMDLSTRRAKSVVDYLIGQGLDPDRLEFKGYGFDKPVVPDAKSNADRAKNRRIEFRILRK